MQNIDPLYFISPIAIIAFSFGLVVYWHFKRHFTRWALLFSLLAYAGAIAAKVILQSLTVGMVESTSGSSPFVLGIYFGSQTAIFEVGGAFLVAYYAVSRNRFRATDAAGYGLGLAMWENGVVVALPLLLDYIIYYAILSSPGSSAAQTLYPILTKGSPSLFYSPSGALPLIGYAILERVSSLLAHFSWGYLAVMAAVFRRRTLLAIALPIGFFIDFLVPYSAILGTGLFELIVFLIALMGFAAALGATRKLKQPTTAESAEDNDVASLGTLSTVNFRRSLSYGKLYLIIGIVVSLLQVFIVAFLPSSPQSPGIAHSLQAIGVANAGALVIVSIYPVIFPLFATIGSLGALMIFVSDKAKGVYEYLISYGVNTSSIFWSMVASAVGLATVVLAVSLSITTAVLYAVNGSIPYEFVELVLIYTIPLTYAVTMFTTMIGMIWSSLTTRRAGINSPVGLAPIFGIFPILLVLIASELIPQAYLLALVGAVSLILVALVAVMIGVSNSKMVRERFISSS